MKKGLKPVIILLLASAVAMLLGWQVWRRLPAADAGPPPADRAVPVEAAPIKRGPIELRRTFSGTLEALARFTVAPKIAGRIERIHVNIGDQVERGQVVTELDNDEHQQAVALAEADLAVAQANLAEARSALEIAEREFERVRTLSDRGVASESQLDAVRAERQAADAALQVAEAQVRRAEANLATARIRLGYTTIAATWVEGDSRRLVAERYADPGDTVAANTPLVSIIEIDPIVAVIHVTEGEYARLRPGQPVTLRTDAFPGRSFAARVDRIAPAFRAESRQARVEMLADNPDHALKPGMFVRAEVVLDRVEEAVIVPAAALTRRQNAEGVFLINDDRTVTWRAAEVGIRADDRVQLHGEGWGGLVVTLGQQLIEDGSRVMLPAFDAGETSE